MNNETDERMRKEATEILERLEADLTYMPPEAARERRMKTRAWLIRAWQRGFDAGKEQRA